MREIGILEVGGFQVGQAQNLEAATGLTVILCDRCSPCGVDIRGGGPASRETPLFGPSGSLHGNSCAGAFRGVCLWFRCGRWCDALSGGTGDWI